MRALTSDEVPAQSERAGDVDGVINADSEVRAGLRCLSEACLLCSDLGNIPGKLFPVSKDH